MARGEVLETVSVVIAAATAVWGISQWRREAVGKRRMEVAEEALVAMYEARDAIMTARAPFPFEGYGIPSPAEYRGGHDPIARLKQHRGRFSRLNAAHEQFRAYFGDAECEPFRSVQGLHDDIVWNARLLGATEDGRQDDDLSEELRAITKGTGGLGRIDIHL